MQASQLEVETYSAGHSGFPQVPHFVLHGEVVKSCAGCGRVLLLEQFPEQFNAWDAQSTRCYDCHASNPG